MTEYQKRILHASQITVLWIATLSGLAGYTSFAVAGIAMYLASLHITHMKEVTNVT
jgi:hypothetical protein